MLRFLRRRPLKTENRAPEPLTAAPVPMTPEQITFTVNWSGLILSLISTGSMPRYFFAPGFSSMCRRALAMA